MTTYPGVQYANASTNSNVCDFEFDSEDFLGYSIVQWKIGNYDFNFRIPI
jgi:hypothetical protein